MRGKAVLDFLICGQWKLLNAAVIQDRGLKRDNQLRKDRRMLRLLGSRAGVVLVFGVLLLALDVGRSVWARVALEFPSAEYRPDPALYADLTWPPGAHLDRDAPLGTRVFAQRCAVCHGPDGKGNGPAAPSMFPRPRDFSSGILKYKSTAAGEPPTDEDLLRTVRDHLKK